MTEASAGGIIGFQQPPVIASLVKFTRRVVTILPLSLGLAAATQSSI